MDLVVLEEVALLAGGGEAAEEVLEIGFVGGGGVAAGEFEGQDFQGSADGQDLADVFFREVGDDGAPVGDMDDEAALFEDAEGFSDGGLGGSELLGDVEFFDGLAGAEFLAEDPLFDEVGDLPGEGFTVEGIHDGVLRHSSSRLSII
jgi:hypothetical protein